MNVGGTAESAAIKKLGPFDLYHKYLLHPGPKAEGNWQVH